MDQNSLLNTLLQLMFRNILAVYTERFFHKESLLRLLAIREILNERKNVLKSVKQAKKRLIPGEQCALNIAPVEHEYKVSWLVLQDVVSHPYYHHTVQHVQDEQTLKLHFQAPIKKKNKKKQPATQVSHAALNVKYVSAF